MLSTDTINTLLTYAESDAPMEMCGLMFSKERFHLSVNSATDPTRTFELSYEHYHRACLLFDEQPWAIVHSHPGKGAGLSAKDCQLMDALQLAKMDWAFIVVGLDPVEVRCFKKIRELYWLDWYYKDYDTETKMFLIAGTNHIRTLEQPWG